MKHCVMFWDGQPAEGGGSFTLQPGIVPSRGILRFTPSQTLREIGSFQITDRQSVSQRFSSCRVTRYQVNTNTNGRYAEVTFLDRRWRWVGQHYSVHGHYNRRGSLYGESNWKTPRQMAAILCEAMDEQGFNVSALPDNIYGPSVEWDGHNPALELGSLAEAYGCIVTLSTTDRVVIHKVGVGYVPRPDSRQMDFVDAAELPAIPKALVFEGGQTSIQFDLPLIPVARDVDGLWKYIRDLSYNPQPFLIGMPIDQLPRVTGWEQSTPPHVWLGQTPQFQLAQDIWRVYAIGSHQGAFQLPIPPADMLLGSGKSLKPTQKRLLNSYFRIDRGEEWRVLPVNETQNRTAYTRYTGTNDPAAEVLGYYYQPGGAANTNTQGFRELFTLQQQRPDAFDDSKEISIRGARPGNSNLIYTGNFTINWNAGTSLTRPTGLVRFDDPVYFQDDLLGFKPAVIRLRTSFPLRDPETHAFLCQQWWNSPGSPNAVDIVDVIKRSDYYFEYCAESTKNNRADFVATATEHLNQALQRYKIARGYSAPYKGFVVDIPPDGIVRSVTWDVRDGAGGITHIDFNMERPEAYLSLQEMQNQRYANYQLWLQAQLEQKRRRGLIP